VISPSRRVIASPMAPCLSQILLPLPLHGDAGGIAGLDPGAVRAGLVGACAAGRLGPVKTFFETMPSARSRQAREKTMGPSSAICSKSGVSAIEQAILGRG
jgi:hypothetical protein